MARILLVAGLLLGPALVPAAERDPPAERASPLRLLVPAYFYPAGDGLAPWDRLIAASAQVPILAIVNPASGPGEKLDPSYTRLLDRAKGRKGLTLLGYVSTRYGKRPVADVLADVDRWRRLYPQIQGVFFDEQANGAAAADDYAALHAYARKTRLAPVVTNPGTVCAEAYLARPATDVACIFEAHTGFDKFQPPAWAKQYAASRFAVLAYQVRDAATMRRYIATAAEQGIGNVYVTDAAGANPWDRLPAYWDEEVAAVRASNAPKLR